MTWFVVAAVVALLVTVQTTAVGSESLQSQRKGILEAGGGVHAKGLLGGLLGGGGGDCVEEGKACADDCCPSLACILVPLIGINLCV